MPDSSANPVIIVGGGVIGLSIGWELVRSGRPVIILDRGKAGRGTSWLSAGMLAADAEIGFEEPELYQLSRESLRRWPDFASELEAGSGMGVDYRTDGTLVVADDRDGAEALKRVYRFQKEQGLPVEWLTGTDALDLEPFLASRLAAAVFSPSDHQVDNRRLIAALIRAFQKAGGVLREQVRVDAVHPDAVRPAVATTGDERLEGSCVILAAGVWSTEVRGLAPDVRPPVRPVKGQMIELASEDPFGLKHVVRGPRAYLAPKSDGRLLVGATAEEMGFDTRVTAGGMYYLLEHAWEVVPGIYDLPLTDMWAGLRPGTRDNRPLLGQSRAPGIVFATGHFRHGILLTPVTAQEIAHLVLTGETSSLIEPFSPRRFSH